MWIFYTAIAMIFYAAGEYYSKLHANGEPYIVFAAFAGYMVCTALWFPALRNNNQLAVMSLIWSMAYALVAIAIGVLVFKEHFSPLQAAGAVLALGALVLLECK